MTQLQRVDRTPNNLPANVPIPLSLQDMERLAVKLVTSGLLPDAIKKPEQAMAIMLKGRELGLPPMQAFAQISVIQGKPCVSPECMLALIRKNCPGAKINFKRLERKGCTVVATRPGEDPLEITFDEEDARLAGLLTKHNWKAYPRAMYRSRAVAEMARTVFPDAIAGVSYTPEELNANVVITADGEMRVVAEPESQDEVPPPPPAEPDVVDGVFDPGPEVYDGGPLHRMKLLEAAKRAKLRTKDATEYKRVLEEISKGCLENQVEVGKLDNAVKDYLEQRVKQ